MKKQKKSEEEWLSYFLSKLLNSQRLEEIVEMLNEHLKNKKESNKSKEN